MNIQEAAKKFFGVTTNYKEAGYVLPDGTMLDLSGKHWVAPADYKYHKGKREVDHRELGIENYDGFSLEPFIGTGSGDELMQKFMAKSGAMRIDFNACVASAIVMPTQAQLLTVCRGVHGGWICISAWTKNGDLINDAELESCSTKSLAEWFASNIGGKSSGIKASTKMKITANNLNNMIRFMEEIIEHEPDQVKTVARTLIALKERELLLDIILVILDEYDVINQIVEEARESYPYTGIDKKELHTILNDIRLKGDAKAAASLIEIDEIADIVVEWVNNELDEL